MYLSKCMQLKSRKIKCKFEILKKKFRDFWENVKKIEKLESCKSKIMEKYPDKADLLLKYLERYYGKDERRRES